MKTTLRAILSLGCVLGFAAGCSLKQNPFADESEAIRNGIPPNVHQEEQIQADPKFLLLIHVFLNY